MTKLARLAKIFLGWPLLLLSFIFLGKFLFDKGSSIIPLVKDPNILFILVSVFLFSVFFILRIYVWHRMLNAKGHKLNILETAYRWESSQIKRFVPGNIWSFLSRASLFSDLKVEKRLSAKLLLFEEEMVVVSTTVLSLFAIPIALEYFGLNLNPEAKLIIYSGVFLLAFLFIFGRLIFRRSKVSKIFPDFGPSENLTVLLVNTVAFFCFGLGTYFAASAVYTLNSSQILEYVGFFSFSLLVGYLSFITPMGLGVREGVITFGLTKSLPIGTAALIAIFSRLILIASELLFAFALLLTVKLFKEETRRLGVFLTQRKHEAVLMISAVFYMLYFTIATFLKHDNFYTGRFDLGNMDQTVWNTIHGRIFQLTDPNGTEIISRLAFHSDFILILLSPLYLLWDSPKMLLLIQSVVLGLGGIFVYKIAERIIRNKSSSLLLAISFYISPAVNFTNLFDFHAVTLATTFFLGAFYFLLQKKYVLMVVFLILAGITKEQVWAITAFFGVYIFFTEKQKKLGLSIFVASVFVFYFLIWHAIPSALGDRHFAIEYYSEFGSSPSEIVKNILTNPWQTLQALFKPDQLDYVRKLFAPLGYLSLFSPFTLVFALPDLLINLLSQSKQMHEIYYQYSATITPFLFISAILGVKKISEKFSFIRIESLVISIFVLSLFSAYSYGPLPFAKKPQNEMFVKKLENRKIIEEKLSNVSEIYSISASNNIGAHLSHRERIYTVPNGIGEADKVVILLRDGDEKTLDSLRMVISNPNYKLVFNDQNFYIFKKFSDL